MLRAREDWSRHSWSLWMLILGVAAAVACASHPPNHDHEGHTPHSAPTQAAPPP
jgi:hypothetical protein